MKYFKLLPTVTIDQYKFKNVFQKLFLTEIKEDQLLMYRINENERIEDLAYRFYRSTEYWWVIAIINNIRDIIFDFPLSEDAIQSMAREKAMINDVLNNTLFIQEYDKLQAENDAKRSIRLVKPSHLPIVIKEVLRAMKS